jgi:hypothetical protein
MTRAHLVMLALVLAGCGGGSSGGPIPDGGLVFPKLDGSSTPIGGPPVNGGKLVRELSDPELRGLCDQLAAAQGGYGVVIAMCDGGITRRTSRSQDQCATSVNQSLKCTATVGDVVTCSAQQRAQPCNLELVFGQNSPACAALLTCARTGMATMP